MISQDWWSYRDSKLSSRDRSGCLNSLSAGGLGTAVFQREAGCQGPGVTSEHGRAHGWVDNPGHAAFSEHVLEEVTPEIGGR